MFLGTNVLINVTYSSQIKLIELSEDEAIKLFENSLITGRERFSTEYYD